MVRVQAVSMTIASTGIPYTDPDTTNSGLVVAVVRAVKQEGGQSLGAGFAQK